MCLNFQRLFMHENFQYQYCNFQVDFFDSDKAKRIHIIFFVLVSRYST